MKNSPNTRERFQQIGRDQLALALATGKFQSLGLTEDMKPAAIEWVREEDAKRDSARTAEVSMQQSTLRYAKIAAWAAIVGVGISLLTLFR
jgi:hypothetical protein